MNLFDCIALDADKQWEYLPEGLRLQKLEVYNWGTFDEKIWAFTPHGETTLLTGDSGSGKSTIVDALITLLVSPRKIAYNKAADATARERSAASYVRGYFGQKYAYEGKGKPEALRDANQYSVLLITLEDTAFLKTVTLATFFYFKEQQGSPVRFYAVAQKELSIKEHFSDFGGDVRKLRAALKTDDCEVFDDYNHYAVCYQKLLGGLKPQAIDLFQQTISMKKVELLTEFVRSSMLEETEIEKEIEKLIGHYSSLDMAYKAVQRAGEQAERLRPISQNGVQHAMKQGEAVAIEQGRKALGHWFATQKAELYTQRVAQLINECDTGRNRVNMAKYALENIEKELDRLAEAIYMNGGGVLERLKAESEEKLGLQKRRQREFERYSQHAKLLELPEPNGHAAFMENCRCMVAINKQIRPEKEKAQDDLTQVSMQLRAETDKMQIIEGEIASLKERTSNIPQKLIALRANLCMALSIPPEQLPFAGELLEVKEGEAEWEGAIERLLHSFALSLLVSEQRYAGVAKWVNENNLGGRLVYFAIKPQQGELPRLYPQAVANKLEVKEKTVFSGWLRHEVAQRFAHICCNDLAVFRQEKKAITKVGQIKSATRHEKDDRQDLMDRTRYVLGFSNQKKIAALVLQSEVLGGLIEQLQHRQEVAKRREEELGEKKRALDALESILEFSDIDIWGIAQELAQCQLQMERIEKAEESILSALRKERTQFIVQKKAEADALEKKSKQLYSIESSLENIQKEQREIERKVASETAVERASYPYLEEQRQRWLGAVMLTVENSSAQERRYSDAMQNEWVKVSDEISTLKTELEKAMMRFRLEFPNETRELDDTIHSLPEYHKMLDQLDRDDLPKYEANFKELLSSRVMQQIAVFQSTLKQQYDGVRTRIDDINNSLYGIDYNPGRYIRINCEDIPDSEIKSFRTQLKACTEGALSGFDDTELANARYLQIRGIIQRFQGGEKTAEADKKWTAKVTDVRNWFVFSASECWRASDEEYHYYADSSGKSGGQKEKLAYTILAASLVYNYGLHQDYLDQSAFRLVVIDEAFLKSSDESARFGLQLFQKLKFQLIIVTPLLKIATIEPFISHVGFVSHDDITHQSALMNIPIEVYKQKRQAWEVSNLAGLDG